MIDKSNAISTNNGDRKVRYAVVGLGWIAQQAVLPAFAHAENSELVALISDKPTKLKELSQQYGVQHVYSYEEYEDCLNSGDIDAVYIALPNHLHRDYTVRAANLAIHVLCEKPMAITQADCQEMIRACEDNGVKLMIAYRLHFEAANMQAVEIVRSGQIGDPRFFNSVFTQQVEFGNIRLRKIVGGGTLDDMGIYCINAARYLFQDEPIAAFATSASRGELRFDEVEEMTSVILRFPQEKLASFIASFGTPPISTYQIVGTKGDLRLESAYDFEGEIKHQLTIDGETQERIFPARDQFAAELIYFSSCILQDKEPQPSGQEGLNDVTIIRALYQSIETGTWVQLDNLERPQRPDATQIIERPAIADLTLVEAADPSGKS